MPRMVIDTDVLIDFLRGKSQARAFLIAASRGHVVYVSVVTVAEILVGMRPSEREKTEELIDSLNILPITTEVARVAARFKKESGAARLSLDDCFIAATAYLAGAALATKNRKHYPMTDVTVVVP